MSPSSTTLSPSHPTKPYHNPPAKLPCPNSSGSFWHSEPSPFLLHHRTTPDLPSTTDIAIIGSGITGTSIARYLTSDPRFTSSQTTNKQLTVTLLEAREICWGATGRNGGHCQPLLFDRSPDIAAFEVKNVHAVKSYIEENDVPCEWRSVTGCRSFWSDELFEKAKGDIEHLREVDAEMGKLVRTVEKGEFEELKRHRVGREARGVTLTEGAGQLWPYKYVTFIVEKLVREGKINVQTNTPVTKVEVIDGDEKYRVALHTTRGTIKARHAILATNGYTSALLPGYTDLIVPVRCEMSALHPPANSTRLPHSYGMVGYENGNPHHDDYLIQRPFYKTPSIDDKEGRVSGGHLMFGGGRSQAMYNCIGESEDDIVDPGEADYLRRSLLTALDMDGDVKGLKELKASHQWTGIKGYSRDNVPWVGKVPVSVEIGADKAGAKFHKGLWLCGGYTGHGMPNATLCGKAVVEMLFAEEESNDGGIKTHEDICEKLVKDGDLPRSYLITGERLKSAAELPSVAEQEGEGDHGGREFALVGGGNRKEGEEDDKKGGKSKCVAM